MVTDAAWGNTRDAAWIKDGPKDWEERPGEWVRHHLHPRRTTFHPGAAPDLHSITEAGKTNKFDVDDGNQIREQIIDDGIRVLQEMPRTGKTVFQKNEDRYQLDNKKIHSSPAQLQTLSSQGGQIVIYHDKKLSESENPAMTTLASWRSYRLKRKTVHTLAAEGQALQAGIGSVHWHRLLFMEAFYGMLSPRNWREVAGRIPFLAAVDSKSLFDAVSKCACTAWIALAGSLSRSMPLADLLPVGLVRLIQ